MNPEEDAGTDVAGIDVAGIDVAGIAAGIRAGRRNELARGITLVESTRADHRAAADALVDDLLADAGKSIRVGISGPPGVGKSTFIEHLGTQLCDAGHRIAVLAVDPSSTVRGGSILGDKTRMTELAQHERAFVRPSPSSGALGGVHDNSRDALLLCEAAGHDVVLVETVGVGQSETAVARLVDTVVVLLLPGAGDELQGIKKGLLEIADVLAVNKADGDNVQSARTARKDYRAALHLVRARSAAWQTPVQLCSALSGGGVLEVWEQVLKHREAMTKSGELAAGRASQRTQAMWQALEQGVIERIRKHDATNHLAEQLQGAVQRAEISPSSAAMRLMNELFGVHL
jgi:LAO/AO transport system kinase